MVAEEGLRLRVAGYAGCVNRVLVVFGEEEAILGAVHSVVGLFPQSRTQVAAEEEAVVGGVEVEAGRIREENA